MTSNKVAVYLNCDASWVRKLTKKAIKAGLATIKSKGQEFSFIDSRDESGKSYSYEVCQQEAKQPPRSTTVSTKELSKLVNFDLTKTKYSKDEKVLMITFYQAHNYSLKAIIKALSALQSVYMEDKEIASLERKIRRWVADFKENGKKALDDKRGAKTGFIKVNEDLLTKAIYGAGSRGVRDNYYGVHRFYTFLVQQKQGMIDTTLNPDKIIAYSTITRGIKKLFEQNHQLKMFWKKGKDGLLQDYIVGIKDITYTNQEWQVDATRFDFMCINIDAEGNEKISRLNLTAVIDVHSGNAVATLTQSIDSYAQVRVLQKAFARMGKPEQIYTDNGMDYVSNHYQDVVMDLGIAQITAQVGQGRQKGKIERFFGVIQTELSNLAGYIGNDVAHRTRIEDQVASKIDIRTSKATRINPTRLLRAEELQTIVDNVLAQASADYQEHREFMLTSTELEDVRQKLGKRELRTIQKDGVRFNNFTYTSVALWEKGLNQGDMVEVYEDIDNINQVHIYHDDAYMGLALNRTLGVDAMSLEEFKIAKKTHKKNHITPAFRDITASQKLYEQYEDHNAKEKLNYTPKYAQPKTTPKENKPVANTDYLDFILEQEA